MGEVKTKALSVKIKANSLTLPGRLVIPEGAKSLIIFSHGSGSSRKSPRNNFVADKMNEFGFATLLFDLLTEEEDKNYPARFDIELLIQRLLLATNWVKEQEELKDFELGIFGSSTGAASALGAASMLGSMVKAVVSRGGRPDLAMPYLSDVKAATLLIIGELDSYVIEVSETSYEQLNVPKEIKIIEGATHLFEEAGTLEKVANAAGKWFAKYLS